jgi:hypothetical protein
MVEVFKTNVQDTEQAIGLITKLTEHFPACKINFDLEDCDRILRVEGESIFMSEVIAVLKQNKYQCEVLE